MDRRTFLTCLPPVLFRHLSQDSLPNCPECKDVVRLRCLDDWYYVECCGCSNGTVRNYQHESNAVLAWRKGYTLAEYHSSKGRHWGQVPVLAVP